MRFVKRAKIEKYVKSDVAYAAEKFLLQETFLELKVHINDSGFKSRASYDDLHTRYEIFKVKLAALICDNN